MPITSSAYYDRPIDPKVKEEWVRRLRSGDYAQVRFRLKGEYGYCCLGLLIIQFPELYPPATRPTDSGTLHFFRGKGDTPHHIHTDELIAIFYGPHLELQVPLTDEMLEALPVDMQNTYEDGNEHTIAYFLTRLNDYYGWTFPQIADWIETWL